MYTFSNILYETDKSTPMTFNIKKCKDCHELKEYIEAGGGHVDCLDHPGPYTIVLLDDESQASSTADRDVFSSDFIWRCCVKNDILPLKKFRLNSRSIFPEDFNPEDVLHHNLTWQDAVKSLKDQPKKQRKTVMDPKLTASKDDFRVPVVVLQKIDTANVKNMGVKLNHNENKSKAHEESDVLSLSSTSDEDYPEETRNKVTSAIGPKSVSRQRTAFTSKERENIVQYIVKNDSFSQLKGIALWQRMGTRFSHHTWQSLKNHFMKKILPYISTYKLPPDIIRKFRIAKNIEKPKDVYNHPFAYSKKEDSLILEYIKKYGTPFTPFSGNQFWMDMEKRKAVPGRTWSSMRQRFLKKIQHTDEFKNRHTASLTNVDCNNRKTSKQEHSEDETKRTRQARLQLHEDSDESQGRVCGSEKNRVSSHQRQRNSESEEERISSEKDNENSLFSSPVQKKKRKLFTAVEEWATPPQDHSSISPVSVKRIGGPSMLDVQVKKHVAHQSYLKLKMKRRAKVNQKSSDVVEDDPPSPPKSGEANNDPCETDSSAKNISPTKKVPKGNVGNPCKSRCIETLDLPASLESQDLFASSNEEIVVQPRVHQVLHENSVQNGHSEGGEISWTPEASLGKEKSMQVLCSEEKQVPTNDRKGNEEESHSPITGEESYLSPLANSEDKSSHNEIVLPIKWPSNFTAEKLVFLDPPTSQQSEQQKTLSPGRNSDTDFELVTNISSGNNTEDEDFSRWSDDGLHYRGEVRTEETTRNDDSNIPNQATTPQPRPFVCNLGASPRSSESCKFVKPQSVSSLHNFKRRSPPVELSEPCNPESFDFLGDITFPEGSQSNILGETTLPHSLAHNRENMLEHMQKTVSIGVQFNPIMVDVGVQTEPTQITPIPVESDVLVHSPQKSKNICDNVGTPSMSTRKVTPSGKDISLSTSSRLSRNSSPAAKASPSPNAADRCTRSAAKYAGALRLTRSSSKSPRSCGVHSPKYCNPTMP